MGAELLNADFESVSCRRAKEFDGGTPSQIDLVCKHGWWIECTHCGIRIDDSNEDINLDGLVESGNCLYCSQKCKDARDSRIERINQEYIDFQIAINQLFTKFDEISFSGGWPVLSPTAYFTFPGCKYLGQIRPIKKELGMYIANGDLEAFEIFKGVENAKS
jgi:hypothetical protein